MNFRIFFILWGWDGYFDNNLISTIFDGVFLIYAHGMSSFYVLFDCFYPF